MSHEPLKNITTPGTLDLVAEWRDGRLSPVFHREAEIERIMTLIGRNQSVLVTGPPGVGKTAVIHGVARRMAEQGRGDLHELSTTVPLVGTRYLGEWQTKLSTLTKAAIESKTVLYFTDIWNLSGAGSCSHDKTCFLDSLRPSIESRNLCVIGEVTPETLRSVQRNEGFETLFEKVAVAPLSDDQVSDILKETAVRDNFPLSDDVGGYLIALTSRFMPSRLQPGPALALLNQVEDYAAQKRAVGEEEPVTTRFVEKVFSIYSGLPAFVISREAVIPASDIRNWFQDRIVGQSEAVEAIVESIALFKAAPGGPSALSSSSALPA